MGELLYKQMNNLMLARAAVRYGSISRAAQELNISQPALTRAISRLEQVMGAKIISRGARGVEPTTFGSVLLADLEQIAERLEATSSALRVLRRLEGKNLSCGGTPLVMESFIPAAAQLFHRTFPSVSLQLKEYSSPDLYEKLANGELDVAIGALIPSCTENDDIAVSPFLEDSMGVFVNAEHALIARAAPLTMAKLLEGNTWILPEPLWDYPSAMLRKVEQFKPRSVVRTNSSSATRWLVRNSEALAISTSLMLHSELREGSIVRLRTDWDFPKSQHVIYLRRDCETRSDVRHLLKIINGESSVLTDITCQLSVDFSE